MIAQLKGEVVDKYDSKIVVDVQGVGYEASVSLIDYEQLLSGETVKLYCLLVVRENSQELYGFLRRSAKRLFNMLITVNGVGPKVALSILSLGEVSHIKNAIASGNVAYIKSASGVGTKGAEKIIVELKDKVGLPSGDTELGGVTSTADDAHAALLALGYSAAQSQQVLAKIDTKLSSEERIKLALKELH